MSLLDANSDELIAAAEQAPPPIQRTEPPKRFSAWGMFSAAPKGVAAGAAEGTASTSDILGAFGQALATTGGSGKGMFSTQTPEERKQTNEANDKLLKSGIDYNSEAGRSFRNVSAAYTPDAQTAHVAESAVFNLFRVGSKALTSAATMGNIPGAVVAGLEEGFTTSDQLGQQGVDLATRTKVGAVTALTNAVGFALPVAGTTWKSTAALAVAGGPASFIAQNAATREILQAADYSKLADQYDPLDPVGLALSTVLPLGFGALAMRGAKAKGPMPDGTPPPDTVPPKMAPPDDLVDAARVNLVRGHMDATNPKPGDLSTADAHTKAYTQAMDQQAAGERVQVADVAPPIAPVAVKATDTPNFKAWFGDSKVVDDTGAPMVVYHGTASDFEKFDTAAPGVHGGEKLPGVFFTPDAKSASNYSDGAGLIKELETGQSGGSNVRPVFLTLKNPVTIEAGGRDISFQEMRSQLSDAQANGFDGAIVKNWVDGANGKVTAELQYVAFDPKQIKSAIGNSGKFDPNSASLTDNPIADWGAGLTKALDDMAKATAPKSVDPFGTPASWVLREKGTGKVIMETFDQKKVNALNTAKYEAVPILDYLVSINGQPKAPDAKSADGVQASPIEARINDIAARNPQALDVEMPTAFDDKGKVTERMTVRDYLEKVKQEAAADNMDAGLIEVAANCFLSGGL